MRSALEDARAKQAQSSSVCIYIYCITLYAHIHINVRKRNYASRGSNPVFQTTKLTSSRQHYIYPNTQQSLGKALKKPFPRHKRCIFLKLPLKKGLCKRIGTSGKALKTALLIVEADSMQHTPLKKPFFPLKHALKKHAFT